MAGITGYNSGSWMFGQRAEVFQNKTLSQKKWEAYIAGVDTVEEQIRRQIQNEGERNLQAADEGREDQREVWQQQWEEFLICSRANMDRVKEADETDDYLFAAPKPEERLRESVGSGESLKVEASGESVEKTQELWAPYESLSQDGGSTITYNGVTFLCDREKHTISLGDMTNPDDVINIPLASGGTLMVNKHNIGDLGRAIGMFSAEDIGVILRTIAEYQKVVSMKYEIEENESDAMQKMTDGSDNGLKAEDEKNSASEENVDNGSTLEGIPDRNSDRENE